MPTSNIIEYQVPKTKLKFQFEDLLKIIADEQRREESILFSVGGAEFNIDVCPEYDEDPGYIGVYLWNHTNEDQLTSVKIRHASGVEKSWEKKVVEATSNWGYSQYMSHKDYKTWANKNEDVFKLEVSVTSKDAPVVPNCCFP